MNNEQILKQIAIKKLEEKAKEYQDSLYKFLLYYQKQEKKVNWTENRHYELICKELEDVYYWRTKRLIINVPPRSWKTEIVSRIFPARCLGKKESIKFISVSYAAWLAQDNSWDCRAIYQSDAYLSVFPRRLELKDDQNTKTHRENKAWWQYYASWSTGTITGKWCDILIIDDPLKPDDADSDTVRIWVNNNYHNTLHNRLNVKSEGAIVIIMQRLHDDDLCWHLLDLEKKGGEKRKQVVIKAIAEEDEEHRNKWDSFFEARFPIENLLREKQESQEANWWIVFSSQYQQEPTNKDTQEFHEERYRYHWTQARPTPDYPRIFTAVDPAFKTWQQNDQTSIITAWFVDDRCYILEITAGRFTADVMQEKIINHLRKWKPEKIWIEAFQAQSMIVTFLKPKMQELWLYTDIEEITQTGDKNTKIRRLVPLYKAWKIYHTLQWCEELEYELKRFPKWKHDDIVDSLQMLYNMYELVPNTGARKQDLTISYDINWNVIYN